MFEPRQEIYFSEALLAPDSLDAFIAWREEIWDLHPVVVWDRSFLLPTPVITESGKLVSSDVYNKRTGTGFVSPPRMGKTSCLLSMVESIREAFPATAVLFMEAYLSSNPTENAFYADMLKGAKFPLRHGRTGAERREQAKDLYLALGKDGDNRRVVLFVDEAQNWGECEWTWLKAVQTHLWRNGIALVVISFGQPQLIERRNSLIQTGRRDLTDRFLRRLRAFRAIRTLSDAEAIFKLFDETRFPESTGVSYSEFFFPQAFRAGWRFKHESKLALQAFIGNGPKEKINIGMEWMALAIKHFLTEFTDCDSAGWKGTVEQWQEAVASSDWFDNDDIDDEKDLL